MLALGPGWHQTAAFLSSALPLSSTAETNFAKISETVFNFHYEIIKSGMKMSLVEAREKIS